MENKVILNDESVEQTLLRVTTRITEIESRIKKFVPTTNMNLELFGKRYNLHVSDMIELKFLYVVLDNLTDTLPEIKIPLSVSGFKVTEWKADILEKMEYLVFKTELSKLQTSQKKLQSMYSDEKKNQNEFNAILQDLDL